MAKTDLGKNQKKVALLQNSQQMDIEKSDQLTQILIELFEASGYKTAEFLRKHPNVVISEPGLRKILQRKSVPSIENYYEIMTALGAKMSVNADLKLLLQTKTKTNNEDK